MKCTFIAALALVTSFAFSCLNHIDALELEAMGLSGVKSAIVGWFPRYPTAYYESRVKRLETKRAQPKGLTASDYDDLSVAYEKMGQTDLAIKRIEEKAKKLNQPEFQSAITYPPGHEKRFKETLNPKEYHRYTTHANWGTFLNPPMGRQGHADGDHRRGQARPRPHREVYPDQPRRPCWTRVGSAGSHEVDD